VRFHCGDQPDHPFRPGGAVAADGIRPQALKRDERRQGIGAVERPAMFFIGHGYHAEEVADLADRYQGRPSLLNVHHRLDHKQIDASFQKPLRLFPEKCDGLFEGEIAERFDKMAGGTDIPGDESLADGLDRNLGEQSVCLPDVRQAVLAHLEPVCPEGRRVDNVRPGLPVGCVDLLDRPRVGKTPGLRAGARGQSSLVKFRPHRAVQNQDLIPQQAEDTAFWIHDLLPFS
jgi:hypothetical protein